MVGFFLFAITARLHGITIYFRSASGFFLFFFLISSSFIYWVPLNSARCPHCFLYLRLSLFLFSWLAILVKPCEVVSFMCSYVLATSKSIALHLFAVKALSKRARALVKETDRLYCLAEQTKHEIDRRQNTHKRFCDSNDYVFMFTWSLFLFISHPLSHR